MNIKELFQIMVSDIWFIIIYKMDRSKLRITW